MEGAQAQLKLLRTRGRRALVVLGVVLLITVVYTQWPRSAQIARTGSEELRTGEVDVAKRALSAYAIEYLVQRKPTGDEGVVTTRERIVVRRPFEARTTRGVFSFARASFGDEVLAMPPDVPAADMRPDAVVREAVREGYADERERRQIAGRACRVFRVTGREQLDRLGASADDFLDVCVDEAGLILEELERADGEIVQLKVAQRVEESPDIDEETFGLEEPSIDVSVSGNSVQQLEPDSRLPGGPFWDLSEPLEGFDHRGRYAVVETDPVERANRRTSVTDVWTRGPDAVFIERLSPGRGGEALPDDDVVGRSVDVGDIGHGEMILGLRTSEVRVDTDGGRVVRVRGTLAPSRLLEIARTLEPLPEGPLVPLHVL